MRIYFDFISPYAYLGWAKIHALAERHGQTVEPVPVLFAALLDAWGHKGPAEIPPKRIYTWKHVVRLAHDARVPIRPPPAHPFNPLLALRLASLPMEPPDRRRLIDALFQRAWARGEAITDAEAVAATLDGVGLPGADLVRRTADAETKAKLKAQTADALARGVFGVPTIEVRDELFWGQDSLPHVDRFLAGDDPVTPESLERWKDLPVGATR